jgi:hypothetical protein
MVIPANSSKTNDPSSELNVSLEQTLASFQWIPRLSLTYQPHRRLMLRPITQLIRNNFEQCDQYEENEVVFVGPCVNHSSWVPTIGFKSGVPFLFFDKGRNSLSLESFYHHGVGSGNGYHHWGTGIVLLQNM